MTLSFAGATPHILVVDDTPENLQIVGETLSRYIACDLSFATDGRQALDSARESPPDLILLDVMMPGMSGFEVCKILKENPKTAEVPVLFLTAKVESVDVVAGFDAGAVDYIAKPFNPPELVARVKTQLKIRQAEAERLMLESQNRLLQKTESLGRMAGAIAHNFNNQLQAVLGNLELALEDLPPGGSVAEALMAAMNAGRRAAEMSGLMLTYLGQASGKREPADFSSICRQSLSVIEPSLPKEVELKASFPSPGPTIRATPDQVQQVIVNLAINAREALGDAGGTIRLSLQTVSAAEVPKTGRFPADWKPQEVPYACLEVEDNGCGISEEDFEKIFDPFFTTKFTGRGLGLAVVLGIVRAHGGVLAVESQEMKGSLFRIFLPLSKETVSLPPEKAEVFPEIAAGSTILLVEDEPDVRRMAATMLGRIGFAVMEAPDGMAAVEALRARPEGVVCAICDLTMPQMDGWDTLTALRKVIPGLPVVLASGYDQSQVMTGEHAEWPQTFIHKPYQLAKLRDAVRLALTKKETES